MKLFKWVLRLHSHCIIHRLREWFDGINNATYLNYMRAAHERNENAGRSWASESSPRRYVGGSQPLDVHNIRRQAIFRAEIFTVVYTILSNGPRSCKRRRSRQPHTLTHTHLGRVSNFLAPERRCWRSSEKIIPHRYRSDVIGDVNCLPLFDDASEKRWWNFRESFWWFLETISFVEK